MADPTVDSLIGDLVDAGATDEEIDAAVNQFKSKGVTNSVLPAMRSGAQPVTHRDTQGKPYITDDPGDVAEPGVAQRMLESGAGLDPTVGLLGDARALAAPVGMAMKGFVRAMPGMGTVRSAASGVLHGAGAIAESPLANAFLSPRMGHFGKMLNSLGDAVAPTEAAAASAPMVKMPVTSASPVMDRLNKMTLQNRLDDISSMPPGEPLAPAAKAPLGLPEHAADTFDMPASSRPVPKGLPEPAPAAIEGELVDGPHAPIAAGASPLGAPPRLDPARSVQMPMSARPQPKLLGPMAEQAMSPVTPDVVPQSIESPIEAQAMGRTSTSKMPIEQVPASKSSGSRGGGSQMSATPGLTINDMQAVGLNPKVKVTSITPDVAQQILTARRQRGMSYAEDAYLQKRLDQLLSTDR